MKLKALDARIEKTKVQKKSKKKFVPKSILGITMSGQREYIARGLFHNIEYYSRSYKGFEFLMLFFFIFFLINLG